MQIDIEKNLSIHSQFQFNTEEDIDVSYRMEGVGLATDKTNMAGFLGLMSKWYPKPHDVSSTSFEGMIIPTGIVNVYKQGDIYCYVRHQDPHVRIYTKAQKDRPSSLLHASSYHFIVIKGEIKKNCEILGTVAFFSEIKSSSPRAQMRSSANFSQHDLKGLKAGGHIELLNLYQKEFLNKVTKGETRYFPLLSEDLIAPLKGTSLGEMVKKSCPVIYNNVREAAVEILNQIQEGGQIKRWLKN